MKKHILSIFICFCLFLISCASLNDQIETIEEIDEIKDEVVIIDAEIDSTSVNNSNAKKFKILSLGDSYTIGQSVCETCRYPSQLKDSLLKTYPQESTIDLKIIARTGWTTTDLINGINSQNISDDYNLATLLIGVNNQYRFSDMSVFEEEFPLLVDTSIKAIGGDKNKLIIISIPDYSFTPLFKDNTDISKQIDNYNNFIEEYCKKNDITYVYITDISREGLTNPNLVASDNLHLSELAYSKFIQRILPLALKKLNN